jgi:hypothetical protein
MHPFVNLLQIMGAAGHSFFLEVAHDQMGSLRRREIEKEAEVIADSPDSLEYDEAR